MTDSNKNEPEEQGQCGYHSCSKAIGKCDDCGKGLCKNCVKMTGWMIESSHLAVPGQYCPRCVDRILQTMSPEAFKYTFTPEGKMIGEVPPDVYYKMQDHLKELKSGAEQAKQKFNDLLQGKRDYEKEFLQDKAVEESLAKYHGEILQGVRCPKCGEKTLYRCDDRKIRCKSCGETRPI